MGKSLPAKRTKIVGTIGPASESPEVLEKLIVKGLNVARINFAHSDFEAHRAAIANIRAAAAKVGERVAIMGDLPGPKMRVGVIEPGPVQLETGQAFVLQNEEIAGNQERVSHSFPALPLVVKPGDNIFLNDGFIQLRVEGVQGDEVHTRVVVGGPLSSKKGMNLPGIDLGIRAFTERDHECLLFAAEVGLDAVSQSFVQDAADIEAVRQAADVMGYHPFIIAKIERSSALDHIDEILAVSDGVMVARGDLGVEIPIKRVGLVQKDLIQRANRLGRPVITATHMLESMISNRRPTRAEVTDVTNAILDGTDCVMLSGETAMGAFPVDAVAVMADIAQATEASPRESLVAQALRMERLSGDISLDDTMSLNAYFMVETLKPGVVFTPTRTGATPRRLTRFRLPVWIVAFSRVEAVCQNLQFSFGVYPLHVAERPSSWLSYAHQWGQEVELEQSLAVLLEGRGTLEHGGSRRIDVLDVHPVDDSDASGYR